MPSDNKVAVLMETKEEQQTVEGVTELHGADGWILDSGRQVAVRSLDYEQVRLQINETREPRERVQLKRPLETFQALNRGDYFSAVAKYRLKLADDDPFKNDLGVKAGKVQLAAGSEMTTRLRRIRLVIWARKEPGIGGWPKLALHLGMLCPDIETALCAFSVQRMLLVCPRCKTIFRPDQANQDYCSPKCSENYRKSRNRAKDKERKLRAKAKKGGK